MNNLKAWYVTHLHSGKKYSSVVLSKSRYLASTYVQGEVLNNQGIFFVVGNFMDYDTYVRKLSDVCPKYEVVWKGGE